jgi:uncharacterized ferritin-like protein (DUF455 family)
MASRTVHDFCLGVLSEGSLEAKLSPPAAELADEPAPARTIEQPARDPEIALAEDTGRLPRPGELSDPKARARCLARFAHHELMAVEIFAWALLRWPELPAPLRRGFLHTLADEQVHCKLYMERLHAHGGRLADHSLSAYFWRHVPAIGASDSGPRAFLAAMGLTFEQANLDFSLLYRDAFREAGDEESARVCQRVHDEEVAHVRLASQWLRRLDPEGRDEIAAYDAAVPFPLGPSRAKGRRFALESRRSAGLGEAFIEYVRSARSPQELRSKR